MPLIHSKAGQWTGEWGRGGGIQGYGNGGGGIEGMGIEPFDFDLAGGIENIPAQQIDFDKETYYQSIVAPAEAARRDATTEAIQTGRALSAHTGRAPGDLESQILAGSIRQAGATSAAAAGAAEAAGLEVEKIEQADLTRRTQAAIAVGQLKQGAWEVMSNIKAKYSMMKSQHAHDYKMLNAQLGHDKAMAEMNRRTTYDLEMFKITSGMEMLKYKEDASNLRVAAGLAMDERESQRNQAYRMEYLDRMSKIQSMNTILDWMKNYGRLAQFSGRMAGDDPAVMGGGYGGYYGGDVDIEESYYGGGGGYEDQSYDLMGAPYQPI